MSSYIQVPIPEERVPEVYELLARLDRGEADDEVGEEEQGEAVSTAPDLEETLVKRMYEESWDTHKALFQHLAEHAGTGVRSGELIEALGLPNGRKSLAGMFGAFGRRTKHRYGGAKPWRAEWDQERGEYSYRMSPEVAAWVNEAAAS